MMSTRSASRDVAPAELRPRSLIDAIGRDAFYADLLGLLEQVSGSDLCAVYRLEPDTLRELGAADVADGRLAHDRASCFAGRDYWRRDPGIREIQFGDDPDRNAVLRADLRKMPGDLRSMLYSDIAERIGICGRRGPSTYWLSVLRSSRRGAFNGDELGNLVGLAGELISAIAKHEEVRRFRPEHALASVACIERSILATGILSRRETEVCARILVGLPFARIAGQLGVSEETVKTYRNRAYQRLEVAHQRDLMMWYFSIWMPEGLDGGEAAVADERPIIARTRRA